MNALIIDNEPDAAAEIHRLLTSNFPEYNISGMFHSLADGVEAINLHQPDLLFLDVELDKKQTGFQLLEKINPRHFEVIFVTAYNKYAERAFEYNAIHFLRKPINEKLFVQAVNKAVETRRTKNFAKRFDVMLDSVRESNTLPQKIMVGNIKGDGWLCLDVSQILRLDIENGLLLVVYLDNNQYKKTVLTKSLKEAEKMLEEHNFIKVHEAHLVNPVHIKEYKKAGNSLLMNDGVVISISRRNVSGFMERFRKL